MTDLNRCPWAGSDPLYQAYHDDEWGVPVHAAARYEDASLALSRAADLANRLAL